MLTDAGLRILGIRLILLGKIKKRQCEVTEQHLISTRPSTVSIHRTDRTTLQRLPTFANTLADVGVKEAESIKAIEQYNADNDMKAAMFRNDAALKIAQLDMAGDQADWQKFIDSQQLAQNAQMVENSKPGFFDKLGSVLGNWLNRLGAWKARARAVRKP